MVICLERGADDLRMVQLIPLPPRHLLLQQNPEWFILLVPAYPGCSGKKAVKRLCVFTAGKEIEVPRHMLMVGIVGSINHGNGTHS